DAEYFCSESTWGQPTQRGYDDALTYLRSIGGHPHMTPGPSACSRVSCSYNTGVWMCNDTPHDKYLISFGSVVDGMIFIWQHCWPTVWSENGGQVFHWTGWNVVMGTADC
ncbi:hypothetical protein TOPH_06944, partial [Tolypocladium ophioglossoides CBS 100239]